MAPIREIIMEDDSDQVELKVTFYPELYLQRRIWVLNALRREKITQVLDIGCGEGELLGALSQPAPWLTPPPSNILPPDPPGSPTTSPTFNFNSDDEIPNLHTTLVHGLDVSTDDLKFAIETTRPPQVADDDVIEFTSPHPNRRRFSTAITRFEELQVKVWKGGLEVINEEFVGIECIVSTELIEHLSPASFPFFAPMLLGVYHPKRLLMTTPSYTFNARFTSPDALPSVRKGYPDPTKRTDRVFRHSDHKFEWMTEEFQSWCDEQSKKWGYEVHWTSIGRAQEPDPYGREEQLGGASFVAEFRKIEDNVITDTQREKLGRETVQALTAAPESTDISKSPHELLAHHLHPAHPFSQRPLSFNEIATIVKRIMEEDRESFRRLEELWFESEISTACGGWIEFLVKAVEESPDLLLKKEEDGVRRQRDLWTVELPGAVSPQNLWFDGDDRSDNTYDAIPPGWTPGEGSLDPTDDSDFGDTTGAEGDISLCGSEEEGVDSAWGTSVAAGNWARKPKRRSTWQAGTSSKEAEDSDESWSGHWASNKGWGESSEDDEKKKAHKQRSNSNHAHSSSGAATSIAKKERRDGNNSTAGWDGDADDSDTE